MTLEGLVHRAVWQELPEREHEAAREAMSALLQRVGPGGHSNVKPLDGSRYPRSYRLRLGRYRVCFIHFPERRAVVFTTAFVKRRQSDYDQALQRHDARVRAYE